jgi:hypothetical protein
MNSVELVLHGDDPQAARAKVTDDRLFKAAMPERSRCRSRIPGRSVNGESAEIAHP